ncbi:TAF1D isoform 5, partial [Pongo abelii]
EDATHLEDNECDIKLAGDSFIAFILRTWCLELKVLTYSTHLYYS